MTGDEPKEKLVNLRKFYGWILVIILTCMTMTSMLILRLVKLWNDSEGILESTGSKLKS